MGGGGKHDSSVEAQWTANFLIMVTRTKMFFLKQDLKVLPVLISESYV
jgi:hypothetical protein